MHWTEELHETIREITHEEIKADKETQEAPNRTSTVAALFAFMGWLTSRDEVSGPFSAHHETSQQAVQLLREFYQAQGWTIDDAQCAKQFDELKQKYPK